MSSENLSNCSTKEKNYRPGVRFICGLLVVNALCVFLFFNASCQRTDKGELDARSSVEINKLQNESEKTNAIIEKLEIQNKAQEEKINIIAENMKNAEEKMKNDKTELTKIKTEIETLKNYPGARMVKVINGVEFAFRWCPAGSFTMGSPETEWDSEFHRSNWDPKQSKFIPEETTIKSTDEKIHNEKIDGGYWILETEVTIGMYGSFINETGYKSQGKNAIGFINMWKEKGRGWDSDDKFSWETPGFFFYHQSKNPSYKISPDQPVTTISYHDALAFCKWLSEKTGLNIDLPTEKQWENSCRAGTSTAYSFGTAIIDNSNVNCNFKEGFDSKAEAGKRHIYIKEHDNVVYLIQPVPVRNYKPNAWGIYDMHGNVREWCKNCVVKGGGWQDIAWGCRSAKRWTEDPEKRVDFLGFRIVISE